MLQFIAEENDNYSIPEQVQMAIEGGCRWVLLNVPLMTDEDIREIARELIPLCKEHEVMLTIVDHVELAKEMAIHGTLLHKSEYTVAQARDFCGPEAIIGVIIDKPEDLLPLMGVDVDFAAFTRDTPVDILRAYVSSIRDGGMMIPLVAYGDYGLDAIKDVMSTGVSGLALAHTITDNLNPVDTTKNILLELNTK